ncbi:hypothetical protein CAEBREN_29882 [Caenorhabditis brenneri]|uniref:BTB domain-containing protein n=1 Tax=Caenorhabditis brenneri TaxID=135651 RepID=G0MRL1_CAEBE|nr:hypothetical protein CAEBREN_29882 [Caenorhabditis brenneri]
MGVTKKENENSEKEEIEIYVKCHLEDHMESSAEEKWHVEADHVVRLVNHKDKNKNICVRGSGTFNKEKEQAVAGTIDITDLSEDFLRNDELTFDVEIGVKSAEGLVKTADFSVKTPDANAVLTVGKDKFYVDKEVLSKKSSVFKEMLSKEGVGKAKNEYPVEDVDPTVFHTFIKFSTDYPVQFSLEQIEELFKMADRFKIDGFKEKCKDFLINSVVDDAMALKLADKFGMQEVIVEKLKPLNTIPELKKAFKFYRRFSDESMRLLLKKLIEVV